MVDIMKPQERWKWMDALDRMVWQCVFPGEHDQVGRVRHMVEALFAGTGREADAALIASELATNALLHTRSGHAGGWFGVEICMPDDSPAYLGVRDLGGTGRPRIKRQKGNETPNMGGRGLTIVKDLALELSHVGSPADGHTVWVHLDLEAKDAERESVAAG